jgi:pyruvate dehydrogenase phosphatase
VDNTENPNDPIFPIGEKDYGNWQVTPEDFVYEEMNVATHLAQNALGGKRRKLFCGAVGTEGPTSRNARDDTTVQVIFFGKVHGRNIEP